MFGSSTRLKCAQALDEAANAGATMADFLNCEHGKGDRQGSNIPGRIRQPAPSSAAVVEFEIPTPAHRPQSTWRLATANTVFSFIPSQQAGE